MLKKILFSIGFLSMLGCFAYAKITDGYDATKIDYNPNAISYYVYTKSPSGASIIIRSSTTLNAPYKEYKYAVGKSTKTVNYNSRATLTYYEANDVFNHQYN